MTANPNWTEIQEQLLKDEPVPGRPEKRQEVSDQPDIVARVFEEKMKALLKEIKNGLFGNVVATVHTIEFQKRGLPHMHLLIFLDQPYKFRNPEDVDTLVSAQIPDPATQSTLYETVSTCMFYGPCGAKWSSYQCPTDSCRIPVIPADSSTIPVEFASQNFEILIFRYLHRNSPRNGPERNGTGMHDRNGC